MCSRGELLRSISTNAIKRFNPSSEDAADNAMHILFECLWKSTNNLRQKCQSMSCNTNTSACLIHCSTYLKEHCIFCHWSQYKVTHSLIHNESWINKANDVSPVISLVTHQGWCLLIKMKESLSRNLHGTFYVKWNFVKNTPFSKPKFKRIFKSSTTTASFLYSQ